MNTIKQTISKKFTRKYCSTTSPFKDTIKSMYKWGFVGGAIAGGMYDTDQRLKKEGEMNDDVLFDCFEGAFRGAMIWGCGPMLVLGYGMRSIKNVVNLTLFITIIKVIIMNIIKQTISKSFVKNYCSKPSITFSEICGGAWSLCIIGGGINSIYKGHEYRKLDNKYENNDKIDFMSCWIC
jgi:hypothetical protein